MDLKGRASADRCLLNLRFGLRMLDKQRRHCTRPQNAWAARTEPECKGPTVVFAASWKRDSWHPSSFQESPMLNSGLFHATGACATLQTINRGSTVQAWLEAAIRISS